MYWLVYRDGASITPIHSENPCFRGNMRSIRNPFTKGYLWSKYGVSQNMTKIGLQESCYVYEKMGYLAKSTEMLFIVQ